MVVFMRKWLVMIGAAAVFLSAGAAQAVTVRTVGYNEPTKAVIDRNEYSDVIEAEDLVRQGGYSGNVIVAPSPYEYMVWLYSAGSKIFGSFRTETNVIAIQFAFSDTNDGIAKIYLDGTLVTSLDTSNQGNWYVELSDIPLGIHSFVIEAARNAGGHDDLHIDAIAGKTACVQPPSGMIGWWPGDGNANDLVGSHHGTAMNGATTAEGIGGKAFSLDGVDDFIRVPGTSGIDPQQFTVDAWVYAKGAGSLPDPTGGVIVSKDIHFASAPPFVSFMLSGPGTTGLFRAGIGTTDLAPQPEEGYAGHPTVYSKNPVDLDRWHHVAMTWDGNALRLYVNGKLDGELQLGPKVISYSNDPVSIGRHNQNSTRAYKGLIDEVEILNRALTEDEIKTIYFAGSAGKCKPENLAPAANAGPDQTVECASPQGTAVLLDGSASSDPDNDALTYTWTENGAVIATGVDPVLSLAYGSHAITLTVDDGKGGTSSDDVAIRVQDTTPPRSMINGMTGTAGNNGWYRSAVTVDLLATDACTGVQEIRSSIDGGPETVTAGDAASVTIIQDGFHGIRYFAADRAGNVEIPANEQPVKIDQTAPVITAAAAPAPNASGWNREDVTVTFTCNDATSGILSCTSPVTVTAEGADQHITGTAVDAAGNDAVASATVSIDKTAPTITATVSPSPNANGWHNTDVTVTFACGDTLSGIAFCPEPVTVTTEGAGQTITGTAVDKAGNPATTSVTLNIDKTPPALSVTVAPGMLWPPDHRMVTLTPSITVTDASSGTMVKLTTVTSSEPDNGLGDGDTENDIAVNSDGTVSLRAERSGLGTGRVYTITYQATDMGGNTATASATVLVPHDI